LPNPRTCLPSVFGFNTFKEAMLPRFIKPIRADLACRRDPHALEPSANRELAIQDEPNENSNIRGVGAMQNFGQHWVIRQIVEIQLLDEEWITGTSDSRLDFTDSHLAE